VNTVTFKAKRVEFPDGDSRTVYQCSGCGGLTRTPDGQLPAQCPTCQKRRRPARKSRRVR
jgi:DNA-directed RNA polymerase subunit RPC12/RpoP